MRLESREITNHPQLVVSTLFSSQKLLSRLPNMVTATHLSDLSTRTRYVT